MNGRYEKTTAGRAEIRDRAAALSRPARNLLLIIDDTRTGAEWTALVAGSSQADLHQLLQAGLIAALAVAPLPAPTAPVAAAATTPAVPAAAGKRPGLTEALQAYSYRELYDRLSAEARPRLGLIRGYRMGLEIEKCSGAQEMRALALRFVDEIRAAHGDTAARDFCRSLGVDL